MPEARFRIVGAYPPPAVLDLPEEDHRIEVTGWVDSTALEYQRASVFVAPVLRGSGTRLKILEAMASGLPVVAAGATGSASLVEDGETGTLVAAGSPEGFGSRLLRMAVEGQLSGTFERTYSDDGLDIRIVFPRASIQT